MSTYLGLFYAKLIRYCIHCISTFVGWLVGTLWYINPSDLCKNRTIGPVGRVFTSNPGHWGLIPAWVIPKTQKWYVIRGSLNKFPDFFREGTFMDSTHTWNSCPLRSNLLRLQCTCCTVPTTSGRPHGGPLMWARQWPSSQPLSSSQLLHNDSLWV